MTRLVLAGTLLAAVTACQPGPPPAQTSPTISTPGVAPCTFSAQPEPAGWQQPGFDDSAWPNATVYSAAQVDPKNGYDLVDWSPQAQLIWGPDLETNNTLLCRLTVTQ